MIVPAVRLDHLLRLSNDVGLFEHAELTRPRREHGYCVDDVARALRVVVREPTTTPELTALVETYLVFVLDAQVADGRFHNRRQVVGTWIDEPTAEDCWGRALWALGVATAHSPELAVRALVGFERGAQQRSVHVRAMAYAALGAAEVLIVRPGHSGALELLMDAARFLPRPRPDADWPWPEPRLRYANAVIPEAMLAAGHMLGDNALRTDALALLAWLLDVETADGYLSVTPVAGWRIGEPRPAFDQQPIEVAALADACARAFRITGEPVWRDGVLSAARWFLGANDVGAPLSDAVSGGGRDGLERKGCNENQGAESTLAMMSTFQVAHQVTTVHR